MNTVIANQYGRVEGEVTESGLALIVDARTPRGDSVHLRIPLDSWEQIVYLLAVLHAVERRIDQFQLKDSGTVEARPQGNESSAATSLSSEPDPFEPNSSSRLKVYGRFPPALIYEHAEQDRLRVFFEARDEQKGLARFDLHSGEIQALEALAERALFSAPQVELLLSDELSLAVNLTVSHRGMVFAVRAPVWQSHFAIAKAQSVATLRVFLRRVINGGKVAMLSFDTESAGMVFRRKPDGRVLVEFRHRDSSQSFALPRLHLCQMEILTRYVLYRLFEPENEEIQTVPRGNAMTAATS